MNWKDIVKILGISFTVIVAVFAVLLIWGLSRLPSAFEIKQSITPPVLKDISEKQSVALLEKDETPAQTESAQPLPEKMAAEPSVTQDQILRQQAIQVLQKDFTDERRPLVDACRSMKNASESEFLKDPQNASGRYFFRSLSQEEKDPLSETAAPALRMIFRAPGMQQVLDMILKADEVKDPGLIKKAEFYYEIYRAGSYLNSHLADLNKILQQSYNLHHLMKAVALKPELAQSPEVISFCEDLEKNLNRSESFDVTLSAQAMQSFLEQNGIQPSEVRFDPKYRSNVDLTISNTQLNVNDAWIAQIFAADIKKAMQVKER